MSDGNSKIQIATFYNENDANKFLVTLLPKQIVDIKVFYDDNKQSLSYTIVFEVKSL